jgi:hypothetical protein
VLEQEKEFQFEGKPSRRHLVLLLYIGVSALGEKRKKGR